MADAPKFRADKLLQSLWKSNEGANVTVMCGERSWKVHYFILSGQSLYFQKVFETKMKESESGILDLKGDDPQLVDMLLQAFYGFSVGDMLQARAQQAAAAQPSRVKRGKEHKSKEKLGTIQEAPSVPDEMSTKIDASGSSSSDFFFSQTGLSAPIDPVFSTGRSDETVCIEVSLYVLADKYMFDGLKEEIEGRFSLDHNDELGVERGPEELGQLWYAVYTTTPRGVRGLRDVVKQTMVESYRADTILRAKPIRLLAQRVDGFAQDMLDALCARLLD